MKMLLALLWLSLAALAGAQGLSIRSPFYVSTILKPPAAAGGASFPSSGLIRYYAMEESAGNDRVDSVGSVDLTEMVFTVPNATGKRNNCANLNGVGYLEGAILTVDRPVTIAFWCKVAALPVANFGLILEAGSFTPVFRLYNNGNVELGINDEGVVVSEVLGSVGAWHLIVGTADADGLFQISIDGSTFVAAATVDQVFDSASMQIGDINGTDSALIDELSIWSRVLTQQEVTDIWNGGAGLFGP